MEIDVTKETLDEVRKYMREFLVLDMKWKNLSFEAMAVILTAIENECNRVEEFLS